MQYNTYIIYCSNNPCGSVRNKYTLDGKYWHNDRPSLGMDINTIHRTLSTLHIGDYKGATCGCLFEVQELAPWI